VEKGLMGRVKELVCVRCERHYTVSEHLHCPECGPDGILDVQYDYDQIRESLNRNPLASRDDRTVFRYLDLLPVRQSHTELLEVGWTPLYSFPRLNEALGHKALHLKDETVNPSGSLKDRASTVGVSMALEGGAPGIACASTGNAASSLAVLSASAGIRSYIFVPQRIPKAKLYQISACGAKVFRVDGTYEDAFDLAAESIKKWGWYNRNCAINPYLVEGKKTCALEIYEQLCYSVPDWVVVPVGDGCIISSQWKAFRELGILGLTHKLPKMLAVQANGCKPIVDAFHGSGEVSFVKASTIADSIRVGRPLNWRKALHSIQDSGGTALDVTDEEIVAGMLLLAKSTGIFAEPAGAAGLAGFRKALERGLVGKDETVALLITGSGLKDPESLDRHVEIVDVGQDIGAVAKHLP
jgi:threonine synthase